MKNPWAGKQKHEEEAYIMGRFYIGKKQKILWGLCLLAAWAAVIFFFVRNHGALTVKELVNYQPENPFLSSLVMTGLFLLKSVDFIMHSGVLYAANGIMFPLPLALLFNLFGIAIMVTPSYFIGRVLGSPIMESLIEKYPKLHAFGQEKLRGNLAIAVLLRTSGLPLHVASLYMGAAQYHFGLYMAGSLLGILPLMIPYTIMGESADNISSPAFITSVILEIIISLCSILIYAQMKRKNQRDAE